MRNRIESRHQIRTLQKTRRETRTQQAHSKKPRRDQAENNNETICTQ